MSFLLFLIIISASGLFYAIAKESKGFIFINAGMTSGTLLLFLLSREYNGIGLMIFMLSAIAMFIFLFYKENSIEKSKYFKLLTRLVVGLVFLSIHNRIMHWPGAGGLMLLGMIPIILISIQLFRGKIMNENYLSPLIVFVPLGIYNFWTLAKHWF